MKEKLPPLLYKEGRGNCLDASLLKGNTDEKEGYSRVISEQD